MIEEDCNKQKRICAKQYDIESPYPEIDLEKLKNIMLKDIKVSDQIPEDIILVLPNKESE